VRREWPVRPLERLSIIPSKPRKISKRISMPDSTKLDAKIAKLREKGRDLKDQAKANWDQKMAELERNGKQPAPSWPRSVTRAQRLGRMSRRESSRPGTNWTKPSAMQRKSSERLASAPAPLKRCHGFLPQPDSGHGSGGRRIERGK